jgi:hypothetical protein
MCCYTDASTEMKKGGGGEEERAQKLGFSCSAGPSLACRLEQISILLFHWMSIHEEINHMRHDNKTHTKRAKRPCLLRRRIFFHQEMFLARDNGKDSEIRRCYERSQTVDCETSE